MDHPLETTAPPQADESVQGFLLDIDRFASHDGPGIRTTVFLKGCPLSCAWCHSPESRTSHAQILFQSERCDGCGLCLAVCPEHALIESSPGEPIRFDRSKCDACGECVELCYPGALRLAGIVTSVGELVRDIERDRPFFVRSGGGVTLSGGEPARQFTFAYNFLLACKDRGLPTALETTGYARWESMAALASVTDLLLYDLKGIDDKLHRQYTGVSNKIILDNLRRLARQHANIQVRIPCISGINDSIDQIARVAAVVKSFGLGKIVLLPYNGAAAAKYGWLDQTFTLEDRDTQTEEHMRSLGDICQKFGLAVQIGG